MTSFAITCRRNTVVELEVSIRNRMLFLKLPLLGQVFAQFEERHPNRLRFHHERHRGEHLLWIGRLHVIHTPWRLAD